MALIVFLIGGGRRRSLILLCRLAFFPAHTHVHGWPWLANPFGLRVKDDRTNDQ
jgi:hypothetical protein